MAVENLELYDLKLKIDQFNWKNLLHHPSEFIRIDEMLRLKQTELCKFNRATFGWTFVAAQENLEHQRLIYRMRCYLSITGTNMFRAPILSLGEYANLKRSFPETEDFLTSNDKKFALLTGSNSDEFWLVLSTACDRRNTIEFYKKLISEVLADDYNQQDKQQMIDVTVNHCDFHVI